MTKPKEKRMSDEVLDIIKSKYPGKLIAMVPHNNRGLWVVTVVVDREDGHCPLSYLIAWSSYEDDMKRHCDELNVKLGIASRQVAMIIASSMSGVGRRREA